MKRYLTAAAVAAPLSSTAMAPDAPMNIVFTHHSSA